MRHRSDALLLCAVVVLAVAALWRFAPPSLLPFEDAAMLLRYAQHVADGQGMVWNVGEAPVDGATDFFFTVLIALLTRCGVEVGLACWSIAATAHVATAALVFWIPRRIHGTNPWLSAFGAAYLIFGPGLSCVGAHFGATCFGFFACTSWCLAWLLRDRTEPHRGLAWGFAFSCLLLAMTRPEGVFLSGFLLVAVAAYRFPRSSRQPITSFVVTFAVLGGAYFVWRWVYFGHPLPNPFYKKGGGSLYVWSLVQAIRHVLEFAGLFLAPFVMGLLAPKLRREAAFTLVPVALFTGIWLLLSDEMNAYARFQYAVLPIVLISWPSMMRSVATQMEFASAGPKRWPTQGALFAGLAVGALGSIYLLRKGYPIDRQTDDGLVLPARLLGRYAGKNYTLATTEAGLLPLVSGWRAVDTWGLNDQWIAHHRLVSTEYLDRYRPEVVMFHAHSSPLTPREAGENLRGWNAMIGVLKEYVQSRDYELAASFGSSLGDAHWYYVRRNFADSAALIEGIRAGGWCSSPCVDLARLERSCSAP